MKQHLLIGTRGSPLALAQTNEIIDLLKKSAPHIRCEVVPIRTQGDKMHDTGTVRFEGKSLFTKEIEDSLIQGEVDLRCSQYEGPYNRHTARPSDSRRPRASEPT